jgi:DNA-binding transcriptional MerR regulator
MCAQSIGQLSRLTRTPVATIRYYEEIGLLPPAERGRGGQRQFGPQDVVRVQFIRGRRALGFSLADVRILLGSAGPGSAACADARQAAEAQLVAVRDKLAELRQIEADLLGQIEVCSQTCSVSRDASCGLVPDLR